MVERYKCVVTEGMYKDENGIFVYYNEYMRLLDELNKINLYKADTAETPLNEVDWSKPYKRRETPEKPTHYHSIGDKDVIDFCNDYEINFNKGNVIKYLVRAGEKNGESELKDLNKALDYLKREIKFKETLK